MREITSVTLLPFFVYCGAIIDVGTNLSVPMEMRKADEVFDSSSALLF